MTGISDVLIRYHNVKYDDVFYCDMLISGNTTTPSPGQYSIVRRVVGSDNVYSMYVFDAVSTEKEYFKLRTTINIEGIYSETNPTTGELTDVYIEQNGVQQGDAYRFTVGRCRTPVEDLIGLGGIALGIYVLYKLTLWSDIREDHPEWRR